MRLVTFSEASAPRRVGVLVDGGVVDLTAAGVTGDLVGLIGGSDAAAMAREAIGTADPIPLEEIRLLAPIPRPPKDVLCVGRNYREHATEFTRSGFDASERSEVPPEPVIFTKAATSIVGPRTRSCSRTIHRIRPTTRASWPS